MRNRKKTAYQKTEVLLYNYKVFKAAIDDKLLQIDYIKKQGMEPESKSFVSAVKQSTAGYNMITADEKIEELKKSIAATKQYIDVIDDQLEAMKQLRYFDIIKLRYFEGLTLEDIAVQLHIDKSTASRNRRRLVDMLKARLFCDDVIFEMIGSD